MAEWERIKYERQLKKWHKSLKRMTSNNKISEFLRIVVSILPLEIHVSHHQKEFFLFDARNYAVLRIDPILDIILNTF